MAILAKTNGWLISGEIISESEHSWVFKAIDEKRGKVVAKNDPKQKIFNSSSAVKDAEKWQKKNRGIK